MLDFTQRASSFDTTVQFIIIIIGEQSLNYINRGSNRWMVSEAGRKSWS